MSDPDELIGKFQRDPTLANYAAVAATTAVYPGVGSCFLYPFLGLAGEVGELADLVVDVSPDLGGHPVVRHLLRVLGYVGDVAGVVSKCYRDDGGAVADVRLAAIRGSINEAIVSLGAVDEAIDSVVRIQLPPTPIADDAIREQFVKESGDAIWFIAMACAEARTSLEEASVVNADKLASRRLRGTLGGSGDDR